SSTYVGAFELHTPCLHDALPICVTAEAKIRLRRALGRAAEGGLGAIDADLAPEAPTSVILRCREGLAGFVVEELGPRFGARAVRSEEHTSELQSRENLVCRLLLE